MRQRIQATAACGYLQVANGITFVVGGVTYWKHATVECDCSTVLSGSMRVSRG